MDNLIGWLISIPNVVYAAVIASLLTLGGVFFTNRSAHKRLITQLSLEAGERKKEREIELRKEVYLKAAEEMSHAQQFLGALSNGNISDMDMSSKLEGFFSATSKMHIVGTDETLKAIIRVTTKFSESILRLITLLAPLDDLKIDIDILNQSFKDGSAKREYFLNKMTEFNLQCNQDAELWGKLQENFDVINVDLLKKSKKQEEKWSQHNQYQRNFAIECIERIYRIIQFNCTCSYSYKE
ncbi:hypothetical protein MNBD_GAMMA23-791 [hydrothermal vent metagenome]|uniref:Uncharacterized protein n=1 Tax=hydrothermal vent metagenome TaxID=652676 RepID=A0A3B1B196_9ZZZZ